MSDPVVIISGGSRGLGLATAQRLLKIGFRVGTFSRKESPEIRALSKDGDLAERIMYRSVDMSDLASVRNFAATIYDTFGRVDALVNNAAVAVDGVLATTTDEQIQQMVNTNLSATLVLTRECVRYMLLGNEGSVINVSSVVAQHGFSGLVTYAATKAAMEGMTKSLARELGKRNIRVNAIAPGFLQTDMSSGLDNLQRQQIVRRTPLGRLGTPADVIPWIEFLLSPQSHFVTGQTIVIDGGASL